MQFIIYIYMTLVDLDETRTPSDHPKANTIFMTKSFSECKFDIYFNVLLIAY